MKRYIHAGWLIDGTGGPIQKDVLLTINAGRLESIAGMDSSAVPENAVLTDLSHCTIVPPLIDALAYLSWSATTDERERLLQREMDFHQTAALIQRHMGYLFTHGVFLVRDGGGSPDFCGRFLDVEGGKHPLKMKIRERDWILLSCSDHVKDRVDSVNGMKCTEVPVKELRSWVDRFSRQGKPVIARVTGGEFLRKVIDAGCRRIDYIHAPTPKDIRYMAEYGALWRPHFLELREGLDTGESLDLQSLLSLVSTAGEYGLKTVLGTGAGNRGILHGESMVESMKLFMKAGYSLSGTVACATENGARFLGVEQEFGRIGIGRAAHFLVTRGTPSQLPRKLAYLEAIYHDGLPCSPEHYLKI